MKICPNCHHENPDEALFCESCGHKLPASNTANLKEASTVSTGQPLQRTAPQQPTMPPKKPNYTALIIGLLALIVVGGGLAYYFYFSNDKGTSAKPTEQTTAKTTTKSSKKTTTTTSSSENDESSKYDKIIQEAKELNLAGKYKESQLKLATIPVSDLAKDSFSSIALVVDELTQDNKAALAEEKANKAQEKKVEGEKSTEKASTEKVAPQAGAHVGGNYGKWARSYNFYFSQTNQIQSMLTIQSDGGVIQENYDGTYFYGRVKGVGGASGSVLSYTTNSGYPSSMPSTKLVSPDVTITVEWDKGGGTQVFYGYLSYSNRLALTDGIAKNGGVNEVWVSQ